jgi:hypothetical protein
MRGPQLEANDVQPTQNYKMQFEIANNFSYGYTNSSARYYIGFPGRSYPGTLFFYQFVGNLYNTGGMGDKDVPEIDPATEVSGVKMNPEPNIKIFLSGNIGPHRPSNSKPEMDIAPSLVRNEKLRSQLVTSPLIVTNVSLVDATSLQDLLIPMVGCIGGLVLRDKVDKRVTKMITKGEKPKILKDENEVEGFDPHKNFGVISTHRKASQTREMERN